MQINFSYAGCTWGAKNLEGSSLGKILNIVGKISDMDNAPLKLNCLEMSNPFLTQSDLISKVVKFYFMNAVRQFYMLLGSFNFLGNPVNLISNLGDFIFLIILFFIFLFFLFILFILILFFIFRFLFFIFYFLFFNFIFIFRFFIFYFLLFFIFSFFHFLFLYF